MTSRKSFVVSYDEATEQLVVCTISNSDLKPLLDHSMKVDWPLEKLNYELTDDVARRLGVTALSVLALHNPELKPMLRVTPLPMPPIED
jgi:hypothetical protein